MNSNWSYSPETPNLGQIQQFLKPCDLEIWQMTLQNNRAPLLCYFKLCASFRTHWWIQIGVTVRKRSIWVKIGNFLSRVTTTVHHNGHYSVSNHQPRECLLNSLIRCRSNKTSKLRVTGLCVGNSPGPVNFPHKGPVTRTMFPFDDVIMTLKFDGRPWKTIGHLFYVASSFVHHFTAIIDQTGVTVRKRLIFGQNWHFF